MLKKIDLIPIFIRNIFDDKVKIRILINFVEKNSYLILANKKMNF